jgi:hypothetical protein
VPVFLHDFFSFMKHSFACAHSFDFAFELDQEKDTKTRKYVTMSYVAVLQCEMIFGYFFGYVRQFVIMIQHPSTSVVARMGRCSGCTPQRLPFVRSSAASASATSEGGGVFACMCPRLRDGPRQFSQTYCFIARNASEEDEELDLQQPKRQWQPQQPPQPRQPRRPPPPAAALRQARTNLATVLIEVFAMGLKG